MYIDRNGVLEHYYDPAVTVVLPPETRTLGPELFLDRTDITKVILNEELEEIGQLAFCGSGIAEMEIPDNVDWIGIGAFARCPNLHRVKLPSVMYYIDEVTFYGCEKLEEVEFPLLLDEIGDEAFMGCSSLKAIQLPPTLEVIGAKSFARCGLEEIHIPASVGEIGPEAFAGCPGLRRISIAGTMLNIAEDAIPENTIIYAPLIPPEELPERYRLMAAVGFVEQTAVTGKLIPRAEEAGHHAALCYRFFLRTHAGELCRLAAEHPALAEQLVNEGVIPHELVEKLKGDTLDVVEALFSHITKNF